MPGLFQKATAVVPPAMKAASTGRVRGPLPHAVHIARRPGGVRVARFADGDRDTAWVWRLCHF
jgi:hypothetical protein